MRRVFSLVGLSATVWVSCLAFLGLMVGMVATGVWHPYFLPVSPVLALVIVAGLALIAGASWRIVRGPGRRRAMSSLLIGVCPLWFLAGLFLNGLAASSLRNHPPDPLLRLLGPLGDSVMDLEARFRYPQRTYGDKVVMISASMPENEARAQVAAMDRHIRSLEVRLGRPTKWTVRWSRGPLAGMQGKAVAGQCMGTLPGEAWTDAEGLNWMDRHEVAHCVLTSHCPPSFDPPSVLVEGWAESNMGNDRVEQARRVQEGMERGSYGWNLRQLTGEYWYHRHQVPAYVYGAPLVDFLIHRFGPEKFLELYVTSSQPTFDADCQRILGLDVDGLDAAYRAEINSLIAGVGSVDRYRLEHLRLDPSISASEWKAFLAEYFAAAENIIALYRHARLITVGTRSYTDARENSSYEERSLRSGRFASLRYRTPYFELAYLANPRRSIVARRNETDVAWKVGDESMRTSEQSRRRALHLIDILHSAGCWTLAPLVSLSQDLGSRHHEEHLVAALDRFSEDGRPRVRVRIEDHSPTDWQVPWRARTYVLAADDLYVALSARSEGGDRENIAHQSQFTYDRHEGIPVMRSLRTTTTASDGAQGTTDLKVVERRFAPIPEEEFDFDRFLEGPQTMETEPEAYADTPSTLGSLFWLAFPISALCLFSGVAVPLSGRFTKT